MAQPIDPQLLAQLQGQGILAPTPQTNVGLASLDAQAGLPAGQGFAALFKDPSTVGTQPKKERRPKASPRDKKIKTATSLVMKLQENFQPGVTRASEQIGTGQLPNQWLDIISPGQPGGWNPDIWNKLSRQEAAMLTQLLRAQEMRMRQRMLQEGR